ncbi:cytochrome c oxidase subunit I [Prochlorothrix hollandica PCC 9006 = CALU 1027]|uniref:Cytochrome c oxidase subunit I n=1 Tax=Prochlorothrix hollandica PCC 9006 = CALU 1027 TaxID=317619 RepID=A0A0M2PZQ3_PROHO|nr:cytochrome c oxidase subunit I [Prochlorothrix hollandica PCC 9006 = CALU 1027]
MPPVPTIAAARAQTQVRTLAQHLTLATLILMGIGSATRVMNAGLACPDWPLCYGQLVPQSQMNLQVFLEWFHRLDASIVGFGTIALAGLSWWRRSHLPRWTPWLASLALVLVVFQGILGGLTVTELLQFEIVTAHLGTALFFFLTLLSLMVLLSPYEATGAAGRLAWPSTVATVLVYGQSILGGLVASRWALHQCLAVSNLCSVIHSHLWGVIPATIAPLVLVVWAWRTPGLHPWLRGLTHLTSVALMGQILIGFSAFKLRLQVEPLTVSHQMVGALLLGSLMAFTVLAWRDRRGVSPSV